MDYTDVIIRFDEISLKGDNRVSFENALLRNVKEFLNNSETLNKSVKSINRDYGSILVNIDKNTNIQKLENILKNIPGISNFSFAVSSKKDIDFIKKKAVQALNSYNKRNKHKKYESGKENKTFKVRANRTDKKFEFTSNEINSIVGEYLLRNTRFKVDIHNPQLNVFINIGTKKSFVYFEKIKGIGGLPVGTSEKLVSLISGGIDSPVASFMMMRRGAKIIFVHFKNKTISGEDFGINKIEKLIEILSRFQGKSKLYIIPFEEFQNEIIANIPSKDRMIIYRRVMVKIAGLIADKEKAKGLITGDSLGQVASQTVENLETVYNKSRFIVFAPLIGMNKLDIIETAKSIGTYNASIIPYNDCCSFFIAKHPRTKSKIDKIVKLERNLNIGEISKVVLEKINPIKINFRL